MVTLHFKGWLAADNGARWNKFSLVPGVNPDSLISMLTIFRIYNVAGFFLQETACFEEPYIWSAAKGIADTLPLCLLFFRRWYKAQILITIRMPETQMPLMSPSSQAALCLSLLFGVLERKPKGLYSLPLGWAECKDWITMWLSIILFSRSKSRSSL